MNAPLLLDLSHTSHTQARTGIQRVARSIHSALGHAALAVTYDPYAEAWRPLEPWETANLTAATAAGKRGAQWPLLAKLRGGLRRRFGRTSSLSVAHPAIETAGVLVPEVFSPAVAAALPELFAASTGPRVAIFHDAIALKFPELTPPKTVARFPSYLRELLQFDGIAANSEDSRDALVEYWRSLGVKETPPVHAIAFGVDPARPRPNEIIPTTARPVVLSVGSIEGRKNHLALLEACEKLWTVGVDFELRLIGLAQRETGAAALTRIAALRAQGRPLRYDGPQSDAEVEAAYVECTFTVYPSLAEGFGLPVIESLAHGKPCVCSGRGALGESARGGGCAILDEPNAEALATTVGRLIESPAERATLAAAARARKFKTWSDYAQELTGWMQTLPRRK